MEINETQASEAFNNARLLNEFKPEVYQKAKEYYLNVITETGQLDQYGFGFMKAAIEMTKETKSLNPERIEDLNNMLDQAYDNFISISGEEKVKVGPELFNEITGHNNQEQQVQNKIDSNRSKGMSL